MVTSHQLTSIFEWLFFPIWITSIIVSMLWRRSLTDIYGTCSTRFPGRQNSPYRSFCQQEDHCIFLVCFFIWIYWLPIVVKLLKIDDKLRRILLPFLRRWYDNKNACKKYSKCFRIRALESDLRALNRLVQSDHDMELINAEGQLTQYGRFIHESAVDLLEKLSSDEVTLRKSTGMIFPPRREYQSVTTDEEFTAGYNSE